MKFTAVLLICLFAVSSADIQFSRTVDTVAPGFEGSATLSTGCTSHDQYGSNDCTLNWGESSRRRRSADSNSSGSGRFRSIRRMRDQSSRNLYRLSP